MGEPILDSPYTVIVKTPWPKGQNTEPEAKTKKVPVEDQADLKDEGVID